MNKILYNLSIMTLLAACSKNTGTHSQATTPTSPPTPVVTANYSSIAPLTNIIPSAQYAQSLVLASGTKFVLAGSGGPTADTAYIYDTLSRSWTYTRISATHMDGAAGMAGSTMLFAGGYVPTSNVDLYNVSTQIWSTAKLSVARYGLSAASLGNLVAFAGGQGTNVDYAAVDFYDASTGSWTTAKLSWARSYIASAAAGTKMMFAGGTNVDGHISDTIDVYDVQSKTWSIAHLSQARASAVAAAANGKIVIAGGIDASINNTSTVDIYDTNTGTWSTDELPGTGTIRCAIPVGNLIMFFVSPYNFYVYNTSTAQWSSFTGPSGETFVGGAALGNLVLVLGELNYVFKPINITYRAF
jgi:hypothetical protein